MTIYLTPCTDDSTGAPCWQYQNGTELVVTDLDGCVYDCHEWTAVGPTVAIAYDDDWPGHPLDRRTEKEQLRDSGF